MTPWTVAPTKPPSTGTRPSATRGTISRATASRVSAASGAGGVWAPSVTTARRASTQAVAHPGVRERRREDPAVHQLAGADDGVVRARRGGAQDPGGLEQRTEIVELRSDFGEHIGCELGRQQPLDRFEVASGQLGDAVEHVGIAPALPLPR